jgi:diguanylate cyclase (GGDEF)-like protein
MPAFIPKQIKEFLTAAGQPFSYDPRKNIYIWFGIFWGLPIPLVTMLLQAHFLEAAGLEASFRAVLGSPMQWFFLLHPVLFGLVFGILGTVRNDKDTQINTMIGQLKELSTHDPLTGLKNRRYFTHIFHDECARSLRRKEALTLLFLDLDHFKMINDTHGHHVGDLVLQQTGAYLNKQCRPYDTVVRWGGEEFIILLRETDEKAANHFAERIRLGIQADLDRSFPFTITISIGLAQYQDYETLEQLLERADQALYHAKQTGRNRVVLWSTLAQSPTHDG